MTTPSPIALITGASRGLGRNAAIALARQGTDVILTYHRRIDEAHAVVAEIESLGRRAVSMQLDVSETSRFPAFADAVREVLAEHWQCEHFDFLINNAGVGLSAPFAQTTPAQFDHMFAIHLKGPFFLSQALLPLIADEGRVINISSGLTRFTLPGSAAYAIMKGGVEVLTRYQAKELGGRGIRVNTLAPGAIETDFSGGAVRDNPQLNSLVANNTALGRTGLPDDIGGAVAALLGPGSGWINAQRIEASGGMFL
ncbi:MAG: SDR family oxidoreductase [Rhodanobacter sp.]